MGILAVILLAVLLAIYGELCAELDARAIEIAALTSQLAEVEQRLSEVEQRPDLSIPGQRFLYLS